MTVFSLWFSDWFENIDYSITRPRLYLVFVVIFWRLVDNERWQSRISNTRATTEVCSTVCTLHRRSCHVGADHVFVFNYLSILHNILYVFYIKVINVLSKVFDEVNGNVKWSHTYAYSPWFGPVSLAVAQ